MGLVESFSGVRGIAGVDIDEELCMRYACALQEFLGSGKIVVGRDTRPTSASFSSAVISCLSSPVDVGMASIPAVQCAVRELKAVGGVMITASHNEPDHNGLKLLRADGALLSPEDMVRVIERAQTIDVEEQNNVAEYFDAQTSYANFLRSVVGDEQFSCTRVLLDPNGGAACGYEKILESFGVTVDVVNNVPGVFSRLVEPNAQSLAPSQERLSDSVFAAGFDCDADRVELVLLDRLISGNEVLALVVSEVLSSCDPGRIVVVNDATSQVVSAVASEFDATVIECPVGEVKVVDTMASVGAVVGGEGSSSGAIVFPSRCRDGLMSLLLVLRYLSRTGLSLSEAVARLPQFVSLRKNLVLSKEQAVVARAQFIAWGKESGGKVVVGDAVKVVFSDSWAWMRSSQTEAGVVRIIVDAPTRDEAEELLLQASQAVSL